MASVSTEAGAIGAVQSKRQACASLALCLSPGKSAIAAKDLIPNDEAQRYCIHHLMLK